jgi:hypothetical protein
MLNKKILIELFETHVETSNSFEEEYVEGEYFPCIKFNTDSNGPAGIFKTSYSDCKMFIWREKDKDDFFISFNSLSVKISFSEYKRLKGLFIKKQKLFSKHLKKSQERKDKELLNKVFANKNSKERRKTLFEKTQKVKAVDDDDVKMAYDYEQ